MARKVNELRAFDYFPTDQKFADFVVQNIVKPPTFGYGLMQPNVLDAGAGDGVWGNALRTKYSKGSIYLEGNDIRDLPKPESYDGWFPNHDYLGEDYEFYLSGRFNLVIGNPPYTQPFLNKFIFRGLWHLKHSGQLIYVLPADYLHSQSRLLEIWAATPLKEIWYSSARPSFTADGKTGKKDEYCIYVWQKGWQGDPTIHWFNYKTGFMFP